MQIRIKNLWGSELSYCLDKSTSFINLQFVGKLYSASSIYLYCIQFTEKDNKLNWWMSESLILLEICYSCIPFRIITEEYSFVSFVYDSKIVITKEKKLLGTKMVK